MPRLLASLLAALLMTSALAIPADAAGKPGLIKTVTVSVGGTFPNCTYEVTTNYNPTNKTGDQVHSYTYKMVNGVPTGAPIGTVDTSVGPTNPQVTHSITTGVYTTTDTYTIFVAVQKPKTGPGWVNINQVQTNNFSFSSGVCSFGSTTVGYTR